MSTVNKAILVGNLGSEVETRYTASQVPVANFSIATSEKWKDKAGNQNERTEWHRVVAWNKCAEACSKYLTKGSKVYVEGKIRTKTYDDKQGIKRYITEIVASEVKFLSIKDRSESQAAQPFDPNEQVTSDIDDIPF